MVTIDSKLGIAIYHIGTGHNPSRFIRFIETSIEMLVHEGISCFVIDLGGIPVISARHLATLLKLGGSFPEGSIMLTCIPERIMSLLNATGLGKMFSIFEDNQSAMRAFILSKKSDEGSELTLSMKKQRGLIAEVKPASA